MYPSDFDLLRPIPLSNPTRQTSSFRSTAEAVVAEAVTVEAVTAVTVDRLPDVEDGGSGDGGSGGRKR